jgi:hypothetical protein
LVCTRCTSSLSESPSDCASAWPCAFSVTVTLDVGGASAAATRLTVITVIAAATASRIPRV